MQHNTAVSGETTTESEKNQEDNDFNFTYSAVSLTYNVPNEWSRNYNENDGSETLVSPNGAAAVMIWNGNYDNGNDMSSFVANTLGEDYSIVSEETVSVINGNGTLYKIVVSMKKTSGETIPQDSKNEEIHYVFLSDNNTVMADFLVIDTAQTEGIEYAAESIRITYKN